MKKSKLHLLLPSLGAVTILALSTGAMTMTAFADYDGSLSDAAGIANAEQNYRLNHFEGGEEGGERNEMNGEHHYNGEYNENESEGEMM